MSFVFKSVLDARTRASSSTTPSRALALFFLPSLLLCGCPVVDDDDDTPPPPVSTEGVFLFEEDPIVCSSPADDAPELSEESQIRGLELLVPKGGNPEETGGFGSGLADVAVVAHDLDGDGDIDVAASEQRPVLYINDGTGNFSISQIEAAEIQGRAVNLVAADIDGDALPELIGSFRPFSDDGARSIIVWRNLGNATFALPEHIPTGYSDIYGDCSTMAIGDVNGDQWLDLHGGKRYGVPNTMGAHPEQVFLGGPGGFSEDRVLEFSAYDEPSGVVTLVSLFTDRDGDGDQDLMVLGGTPEWGSPTPGSAFFRNDGTAGDVTTVVNDAAEVGTELFFSAMGVDSADLNGDGVLDYCASDVGPPRCYLSTGSGTWYEGDVVQMGLTPVEPVYEFPQTIGWSFDFRDLNNDGLLDVLQASGPDHGGIWSGGDPFPDLLWMGTQDGTFVDRTAATGFGTTQNHVGMVTADFDGNGALDVLFQAESNDDIPRLYMNRCTEGHWTNVDLLGPEQNTEGYGARLEFNYGTQTQIRELYGIRATAQGPSRVHQGLGENQLFDLKVTWPDGVITEAQNLPADRIVTAVHPDAQ